MADPGTLQQTTSTTAASGTTSNYLFPGGLPNFTLPTLNLTIEPQNPWEVGSRNSGFDTPHGDATLAQPPTQATVMSNSHDVINELYSLANTDPAAFASLQAKLRLANYGKDVRPTGFVDEATVTAYNNLLQDTANYAAHAGRSIPYTPQTLLDAKLGTSNSLDLTGIAGTAGGASAAASLGLSPSGQKIDDPQFVQRLATDTYQKHVGRAPKPAELAAMQEVISTYAMGQHPTEVGAAQVAENAALSNQGTANEAGALNETHFADVLMQMMGRSLT